MPRDEYMFLAAIFSADIPLAECQDEHPLTLELHPMLTAAQKDRPKDPVEHALLLRRLFGKFL